MTEVEPMIIEVSEDSFHSIDTTDKEKKKLLKRKRERSLNALSPEEKGAKICTFQDEINSLVKFYKDLICEKIEGMKENVETSPSLNCIVARLMEESELPLSKIVDWIFEKLKGMNANGGSVTMSSVKSVVLSIGQRIRYGVPCEEADILEDDAERALWCWETRDLKLLPSLARVSVKVRRTVRKQIHERISAVMVMINALEKADTSHTSQPELTRAAQKLSKVLGEPEIRLLMRNLLQKTEVDDGEKEVKTEGKLLIKQMEKNKRELEKEKKRMDKELQKEKIITEKELKRLQDEAEKEERRREKEENIMQKQLKKQREESEKQQKRREKEEAISRKQLDLKKQASVMERFLKRKRTDSASPDADHMKSAQSEPSSETSEKIAGPVTVAMDTLLAKRGQVQSEDLWKSHLSAWHSLRRHCTRKARWGLRQRPKTELVKELKLSTYKEPTPNDGLAIDKILDGWADLGSVDSLSSMDDANNTPCSKKKRFLAKQLLQFDKSNRPAFYGIWRQKSQTVGARHPLVKDPDIDYEIDSDEEWEEDEPGESLSDCDDDEDGSAEENTEEESESDDGYIVPHGYLSEDEGVKDTEDGDDSIRVESNMPSPMIEQISDLLRQQKYLSNLTEHALKKNQALFILNLNHEKTTLLPADELLGKEKLERMCLQALSIRPFCGTGNADISVPEEMMDDFQSCSSQSTPRLASATAILDSSIPKIVSVIESCPHSIVRIVELLQTEFPSIAKSQLRNKVREVSEFVDNRWQVKTEITATSISPENFKGKAKSMSTFLKRCVPPSAELPETSPLQPSKNDEAFMHKQDVPQLLFSNDHHNSE